MNDVAEYFVMQAGGQTAGSASADWQLEQQGGRSVLLTSLVSWLNLGNLDRDENRVPSPIIYNK